VCYLSLLGIFLPSLAKETEPILLTLFIRKDSKDEEEKTRQVMPMENGATGRFEQNR
jgi:hypothetical protein